MYALAYVLITMLCVGERGKPITPRSFPAAELQTPRKVASPDKKTQKHLLNLAQRYLGLWKQQRFAEVHRLLSHETSRYRDGEKVDLELYPMAFRAYRRYSEETSKKMQIMRLTIGEARTVLLPCLPEDAVRNNLRRIGALMQRPRLATISFQLKNGVYLLQCSLDKDGKWRFLHLPYVLTLEHIRKWTPRYYQNWLARNKDFKPEGL